MQETPDATILTAGVSDSVALEPAGDVESCRTFMSMLSLADFERFVEKGRVSALDAAIDKHYVQFHRFLRDIQPRVSSQPLLERFFDLDQAWSDALSFDNWFVEAQETSHLRFRKPHECPPGSRIEHAREEFLLAIETVNASLKALLSHIQRQYPELESKRLSTTA